MLPTRELPGGRRVAGGVALAVLAALVVGGALVFGLLGTGDGALERVPADADVVVEVDPAIVDDERTRTLVEEGLVAAGDGSFDAGSLLAAAENRTRLDAGAVDRVVAYGRYDATGRLDPDYAAVVVHADWREDAIVGALSNATGIPYAETTARGVTVYRPGDAFAPAPTVAVLGEGEYVVGTKLAVGDAVLTAAGEEPSLSGPLRRTFADTETGLVTVAARVPSERFDALGPRMRELTRLKSVQVVTVSYDATDDGIALRVRLRTNGTEAARDVRDFARGGLSLVAGRIDNATTADLVRSVAVTREGRDVTVSLDTTVAEVRTVAAYYRNGTAVPLGTTAGGVAG